MHIQSTRHPSKERTTACEDELFQRVVALLQQRLGGRVRNFQIMSCNQGLHLSGQVTTYYGKQMAQEVVTELSGLPVVANEIEVHRRTGTHPVSAAAK